MTDKEYYLGRGRVEPLKRYMVVCQNPNDKKGIIMGTYDKYNDVGNMVADLADELVGGYIYEVCL